MAFCMIVAKLLIDNILSVSVKYYRWALSGSSGKSCCFPYSGINFVQSDNKKCHIPNSSKLCSKSLDFRIK